MTKFDTLIARATDAFEAGFTTTTAQKDALSDLNRAFDILKANVHTRIINEANAKFADELAHAALPTTTIEEKDVIYRARHDLLIALGSYDIPDYPHVYKDAKHAVIFGEDADAAAQVRDLRNAIKAAPIQRVERPAVSEREIAVTKALKDILALRKTQYARALQIGELFNGLPVSCNTHGVVNEHGTFFLRTYFYLAGALTPLQVIIAAADELARREEA